MRRRVARYRQSINNAVRLGVTTNHDKSFVMASYDELMKQYDTALARYHALAPMVLECLEPEGQLRRFGLGCIDFMSNKTTCERACVLQVDKRPI